MIVIGFNALISFLWMILFNVKSPFCCNLRLESIKILHCFRLGRSTEFAGLIAYRQTMTFVHSSKPILIILTECRCALLIYIFVEFQYCLRLTSTTLEDRE